jgi:hypothetical protein
VPPPATGTPTPFVNTANLNDTVQVATTVFINGKPAVVKKSVIPFSSGAPPAAIKGLLSPPPVNNKCTFVTSAATVFVEGSPIERHRDATLQNHGNCPGGIKLRNTFSLDGSGISLHPALTAAQREEILKGLEGLHEQPVGRELLDNIRTSAASTGHTVSIQITGGGSACGYANPAQRFVGGTGTNANVSYNPADTELALGHELIHAYHAQNAMMVPGTAVPAIGPAHQNIRELQAIGIGPYSSDRITENQLRNERGLSNRHSHYDPDQNDYPYNPAPGSRAAQIWSTGSGGEKLVYADK